jgi:large subunit ribosomal protein L2
MNNIQIFKPTTPSKRHQINLNYKTIINKKPILKTKNIKKISSYGRNSSGKITVRHINKGNKKKYRILSYLNKNTIGIVYSLEYDPNRNALIASIFNIKLKTFFYIIAPEKIKIGNIIKTGNEAEEKIGHFIRLLKVPIGCPVYNLSINNNVSKISKAAGTFSILIDKNKKLAKLILSSNKQKLIKVTSFCTIGRVSNKNYFLKQLGKAGRSRWSGKRPTTNGICMNPIDHPNGGGEGKKSSKSKTPWGKPVKKGKIKKNKTHLKN